jgi:hypothetical protein
MITENIDITPREKHTLAELCIGLLSCSLAEQMGFKMLTFAVDEDGDNLPFVGEGHTCATACCALGHTIFYCTDARGADAGWCWETLSDHLFPSMSRGRPTAWSFLFLGAWPDDREQFVRRAWSVMHEGKYVPDAHMISRRYFDEFDYSEMPLPTLEQLQSYLQTEGRETKLVEAHADLERVS